MNRNCDSLCMHSTLLSWESSSDIATLIFLFPQCNCDVKCTSATRHTVGGRREPGYGVRVQRERSGQRCKSSWHVVTTVFARMCHSVQGHGDSGFLQFWWKLIPQSLLHKHTSSKHRPGVIRFTLSSPSCKHQTHTWEGATVVISCRNKRPHMKRNAKGTNKDACVVIITELALAFHTGKDSFVFLHCCGGLTWNPSCYLLHMWILTGGIYLFPNGKKRLHPNIAFHCV